MSLVGKPGTGAGTANRPKRRRAAGRLCQFGGASLQSGAVIRCRMGLEAVMKCEQVIWRPQIHSVEALRSVQPTPSKGSTAMRSVLLVLCTAVMIAGCSNVNVTPRSDANRCDRNGTQEQRQLCV